MPNHQCHMIDCEEEILPKQFACKRHWRMLPEWLKDRLCRAHRPGPPSDEYIYWAARCIACIAGMEKKKHTRKYRWTQEIISDYNSKGK